VTVRKIPRYFPIVSDCATLDSLLFGAWETEASRLKVKFHYAILLADRSEACRRPAESWNLAYHLPKIILYAFYMCQLWALHVVIKRQFLANVNSRSRSLYAIARPSVVCLSVCRL